MNISNIVEFTWILCYPRPTEITVDLDTEVIEHDFQEKLCKKMYGLKVNMATTANPQDNSIEEIIHQTLAKMVCTR